VTTVPDVVAPAVKPDATAPDAVQVLPLDVAVPDSAGLMDAAALRLDPKLWARSSAYDLARALNRVEMTPNTPPSLRRFFTDLIQARFQLAVKRLGLCTKSPDLRTDLFEVPGRPQQLSLF